MATNDILKIVIDNTDKVLDSIKQLTTKDVLVGIPSTNADRKDGKINNALLGYVMNFGSPKHNIPAREFMYSGIASVQDQIIVGLRRAAEFALEGKQLDMNKQSNAVGLVASSAIKQRLNSNIPPPLHPATVAARLRRTKGGRRLIKQLRANNTDMGQWGNTNLTALVDTVQLRNSITYVLQTKGKT